MSKQLLGLSRYRHVLGAALLVALAACDPAEPVSAGYLEVLPASATNSGCEEAVPGQLQVEGVVGGHGALVTGDELCTTHIIRRELPAGLYAVAWQADAGDDASETGEHWALRGPSVVSVFPGQVTRLLVRQVTSARELAAPER